MKLFVITSCLAISLVHCIPQPVTQTPGYTQLSSEQVRHLQERGFGETVKTFVPTAAYREVDKDYEPDSTVHLICMPPGGDNICEKSSDYHFVNDFLYKPVNLEEHQQKPNVSLRYSDRYYPEVYRQRNDDYDEEQPAQVQHQHSVRVPVQQRLVSPAIVRVQPVAPQAVPQRLSSTLKPQGSTGQVFRSPEEINISLQQRRPFQYPTSKYDDDDDY
ncbi:uncharacterized protein LOC111692554, partial [Anoplophora glabripennis]|uniref:uncharacterized protein LOC111692554 n=1 Tax=Anoplophora glabripennis TaxID=217634 RepID=UPI000C761D27